MAQRYFISGQVSDADFFTGKMSADFTGSELSYILFYSDEFKTLATPTGGNVTYSQTADEIHYREMAEGSFLAAESYLPTRIPANGLGLAVNGKLTLLGVTGATHFTACVWRY